MEPRELHHWVVHTECGEVPAGAQILMFDDLTFPDAPNAYSAQLARQQTAGTRAADTVAGCNRLLCEAVRHSEQLGLEIQEYEREHVQALIDHLASRVRGGRPSPATKSKHHAFVADLLYCASESGYPNASSYVAALALRPRALRIKHREPTLPGITREPVPFSPRATPHPSQVGAWLEAAQTDFESALVNSYLGAGARRTEFVLLDFSHIEKLRSLLNAGVTPMLTIPRAKRRPDGRLIPLDRDVAEFLVRYADRRLEELRGVGIEPKFVFCNRHGGQLSVRWINYTLERIGKRAGVGKLTPHALRRRFARDWIEQNGATFESLWALADALGHASLDTLKHYLTKEESRIVFGARSTGDDQ